MLIFLLFELLLVAVIVLVLPRLEVLKNYRPRMFRPLRKLLEARPWLATCLAALFSLFINAGLTFVQPPAPSVHDEFSYLLAADTFSRGRWTNPAHPLWEHFESFHINQKPTYASKYPPGQGLLLAVGQRLTGRPIVGSWLGIALMVAAVSWMFQGFLPFRWAVLGSLLLATNAGLYLFWGQTYWGGQLTLAGAALALGAMPRLVNTRQIRYALLMAGGISLLALTRPYEGVLFTALIASATCWRLYRSQISLRDAFLKVLLPGASVLLLTVSFLLYYNFQVTGDMASFPYMVHHEQYEASPFFLFQSWESSAKTYRHRELAEFYQTRLKANFDLQHEWAGFLHLKGGSLSFIWVQFFSFVFVLPLIALLRTSDWTRHWPLFAGFSILFAGSLVICWLQAHYLAAAAPLLFLLVLEGMRRVRVGWHGRGRIVIAGLVFAYCGVSAFRITLYAAADNQTWHHQRQQIVQKLNETPEKHLIVVHYAPGHDTTNEWVYNAADIEGSQVVWAREMDPAHNRRLLDYFKNRRVWLLLADAKPPRLIEHKPQKPGPSFAPPANSTAKPVQSVVQSLLFLFLLKCIF